MESPLPAHCAWIQDKPDNLNATIFDAELIRTMIVIYDKKGFVPVLRLDGTTLVGIDLHDASLSEANLVEYDLSGACLSHADLSHADLRHARLVGADLSHARLTGADLDGADLGEADLSEAEVRPEQLARARTEGARLPVNCRHAASLGRIGVRTERD